jgi:DNA-binding transcriptional ArsR family regulator
MNGGTQALAIGETTNRDVNTGAERLPTEAIFTTLSNRRRRYTLHYLAQVGDSVTIRDLSEQIAAWENRIDRRAVTPKQRKRVYTALHQTHLPMMDRLGAVAYDRDRGTVATTEHLDAFEIYLDVVPRNDIPWSQFYLALGGVLSALVVVAALGIPPFSSVDGFGYALAVAAAVTVAGGVHTLRDRRTRVGTTPEPTEVAVEPPRDVAVDPPAEVAEDE